MAEIYFKMGGLPCHISTSDFDHDKYPIPPKLIEPSEQECCHTPMPEGYNERIEWVNKVSRTHAQVLCPRCGLWAIWLPKLQAKHRNKKHRDEMKAFLKGEKQREIARLKAKIKELER